MNKKWKKILALSSLTVGFFWWTPESRILNPFAGGDYARGFLYNIGNTLFYLGILVSAVSLILIIKNIEIKNIKSVLKTFIISVFVAAGMFIGGTVIGLFVLNPRIFG